MSKKTAKERPLKKRAVGWGMPLGSDRLIFYALLVLTAFGVVMIGSATMGLAVSDNSVLAVTVIKQIVFSLAGYMAMVFVARKFTMKFLKSDGFIILILFTGVLLLLCLLFPGSGGSHAWLQTSLGGVEISIQPSEFAKIVAILVVAAYCGDVSRPFENAFKMLVKPIAIIGVYVFIVAVLQSDLGSGMIILFVACVCFLVPANKQMKRFQIALAVLFWIGVVALIILLSPLGPSIIELLPLAAYQKNRFLSALNPFQDAYGTGYQLINGLISFASGGLFGRGFGNSLRKYTNFPAANTDYILAILVEELGFAGFFVLMVLYGIIIIRLFHFAFRMKSEKGRIILIGTAMYFIFHIFLNIGGITGLIPLTGVPLLLVSAGGSSTMAIMICVGLSQAVIAMYERGEIA